MHLIFPSISKNRFEIVSVAPDCLFRFKNVMRFLSFFLIFFLRLFLILARLIMIEVESHCGSIISSAETHTVIYDIVHNFHVQIAFSCVADKHEIEAFIVCVW